MPEKAKTLDSNVFHLVRDCGDDWGLSDSWIRVRSSSTGEDVTEVCYQDFEKLTGISIKAGSKHRAKLVILNPDNEEPGETEW